MHPTLLRPAKGFWGRSFDELRRYAGIAVRFEGVKGPSGPLELQAFDQADAVAACKVMTDEDLGGYSTAAVDWVPPVAASATAPATAPYMRFHGTISTRLPALRPDVQRTGYAAWRTADRLPTVFGRPVWDVDSYAYLALRVRSDGRSYLINVQTDAMVAPTDLHQHRLFARRPGYWETVVVPWGDFVRTNHGYVVEPQTELLRQRLRSVGLGLTDRVPGPFALCVARIWATNAPQEADALGDAVFRADEEAVAAAAATTSTDASTDSTLSPSTPSSASGLKNKQGLPVRWDAPSQPHAQ